MEGGANTVVIWKKTARALDMSESRAMVLRSSLGPTGWDQCIPLGTKTTSVESQGEHSAGQSGMIVHHGPTVQLFPREWQGFNLSLACIGTMKYCIIIPSFWSQRHRCGLERVMTALELVPRREIAGNKVDLRVGCT